MDYKKTCLPSDFLNCKMKKKGDCGHIYIYIGLRNLYNYKCVNRYLCCCSVTKSCLTVCDPMDYSPPNSSVHGISQARILEWVAISFSNDTKILTQLFYVKKTHRKTEVIEIQ